MKNQKFTIFLLAFVLVLVNASIAQTISYGDSWGPQGFSLEQESKSNIRINYSIIDMAMTDIPIDGIAAKSIALPGVFLPNDEGAPDLPGDGKYIAVPQGAEPVITIKATRKEIRQNVEIAPAPDIPLDADPAQPIYEKDQKIYSNNEYYPAEPVQISKKFKIRGVDVVMLGITPFQYNPVTKELIIYHDLVVEIDFIGGNGQFGEERLRSKWWDPILFSSILNASSLPLVDYSHTNNTEALEYEYVIITPNQTDFITWANTIRDFRMKQGIETGVVTTDDLGGNTVANIEGYIDNAYNTWSTPLSAVLLLGDYSTGTNGIISQFYSHPAGYPAFASDNKYADVDGDELPDVILARITARDATELETMVTKFINYETNPPTDANFYHNPITALGWQTERWFQICSETVGGYFKNVHGKEPVRINKIYSGTPGSVWSTATNTSTVVNYFAGLGYIPSDPSTLGGWDGGTAADVVNAINAGSFLLQHRDHGYYYGWGEPAFTYSNISSLTNVDNKLPFVFSINCQTGAFHRNGADEESFTERFHRYTYNGQNSGALGLIAATEVSYSFVNDTYVWGLYDNMFPDFMPDEITQFPANFVMPAFGNAAGKHFLSASGWPYNSWDKEITYRLFHHHGDAFLTLYSEIPQALTVSHPPSILNSETSMSVTADDGSFISLYANGSILGTADGTGSAVIISFPAQAAGTVITVTITKQNYYRYESDVNVIAGGILADFSANNQTICTGETVIFTDQSTGNITDWNWSFPGGTPASSTSGGPVNVTYSTAGTYDVSLYVSDGSNNDTEVKQAYITVQDLVADFSASQTTVPVGGSITYTNLSSCASTYNWTFDGGFPASSTDENPGAVVYNTAGDFDVSLEVSNGTSTDTKVITISVVDIQYCNSAGNNGYEWISSIDIGGQTTVTGQSATGYEDMTHIIYNVDPGSANALTLTPEFAGRSRFQYWSVWVDYNADGDFDDSGENVLNIPKKKSVVETTLNIPTDASGTTRMRIIMKYNSYAGSCESGFDGEVEDYTLNFAPPVPQPPVAAFSADTRTVQLGGTVNFTDESLNDPISWSWTFDGGTPVTSTSQNPSVTYNALGTFNVSLTVSNAQGSDTHTETAYITVIDDPGTQYCIPSADNSSDWIETIVIGGVTHNSGQGDASGYEYFTSPSFTFTPGATYQVSLTPYNARNRNFWRIWIDFNNDGDFDDTDETVFTANNKKGTYTGSITIPTGVEATSPDRMRITMKTGGSPTVCETGFNGEVEDYDVTYGSEDLFNTLSGELELLMYPNPAEHMINIVVQGNREQTYVAIYNATGNQVQTFMMEDQLEQLEVDGWPTGMYFIRVYDGVQTILQKFIVK